MKRIMNEGNPLAFGDPEIVASMIADAVSRPNVTEEEYQNAMKVTEALESGDRGQAEDLMGRQMRLAEKAYQKPRS